MNRNNLKLMLNRYSLHEDYFMHMRKILVVLFILLITTVISAQTTKIRGRVLDSSGAVMAGAEIKIYQGDKLIKEGKTEITGQFEIDIDPGEYRLEVMAADFEPYTEVVRATPELGPLSITMALAQITQTVEVKEDRQEVSISAENNLSATVLGEDFISQLPDDEDELRAILEQIAGAGGGPGGGAQFIIDGFTSGRLPPKDQIMQIRINNNPYSTEFSQSGWGRAQIITRAGSGAWRGSLNFQFRDESLNARNAFATARPPYQQRNFNTQFSGPAIPGKLSLAFNANHSESEDSNTIRAITPTQLFSEAVIRPNTRRNLNTRGQYQISKNNMMNFNLQYGSNKSLNQGVGGFNLAERAADRTSRDFEIQLRETFVLGQKFVHETRFSVNRDRSSNTPRTSSVAINVLDAFQGGGAQNRSDNKNKNWEFGNLLTYASRKLTLKTGFQGHYRDQYSRSENNFLGTFVFSSLQDYLAGRPVTFTLIRGDPLLEMTQFEAGAFLQSDWNVAPRFSISAGARYEAQTNISDHNNFDPRVGLAFKIDNKTMLRGGSGLFRQRLNIGTVENLLRLNGTRQQQIVIRNPSYPDPFQLGSVTVTPVSIQIAAEDLATPYTVNSSVTLERTLPKGLTLTGTYEYARGIHLYRSRNINAPLPGTLVRPDPTRGNILQLESTGLSESRSLTLGFNQRLASNFNYFGNYTLSSSYSDVAGGGGGGGLGGSGGASQPMDNYNLRLDWGRSNDYMKHRMFAGVSFRMPWDVFINTRINASSGRPYSITTGRDDNGDTVTSDRPAGVLRNSGNGPDNFNMGLNFTKTIRLRNPERPAPGNNGGANGGGHFVSSFAEPQGGGGFPGGQRPGGLGGPDGGGRGPGLGGQRGPGLGGQRGPNFGQPSRLELQFFANIDNLLNHTNFNNFSGVLTSPFFGLPTSANRPREIQVGLRFNF